MGGKDPISTTKTAASLHNDPKDKVWTQGCIEALKSWMNRNLYIVAGSALGIALMQVLFYSFKLQPLIYECVFYPYLLLCNFF